jgi:hypothetical protein
LFSFLQIPSNGLILSTPGGSGVKEVIQVQKDEEISSKKEWERSIDRLEIRDDKESTLLLGSREGYDQYQKEFAPSMSCFHLASIWLPSHNQRHRKRGKGGGVKAHSSFFFISN